MTAIIDAGTVLDILVGRATTPTERLRIAGWFVLANKGGLLESIAADPENPTNEEKAELFLKTMRYLSRELVGDQAVRKGRLDNETIVETARDNALTDLT